MRKRLRLEWRSILPWFSGVPLLLAFWGYWAGYVSLKGAPTGAAEIASLIAQTLYNSVQIYTLSINNELMKLKLAGYLQLELARWLALVVTTSVFVNLFRTSLNRIGALIRSLRGDSVAIHGDEHRVALLKQQLGSRAIAIDAPEKFHAPSHILAFESTRAMYQYINQHHGSFFGPKPKRLYLCAPKALHPLYQEGEIRVSNVAENCARSYWEDHWLRRGEKRVAIIGFGEYGRSLITQALLVNVYEACREIRYTIYGGGDGYLEMHPQILDLLSLNAERSGSDSLFFREGPWIRYLEELRGADRIIICEDSDEDNLAIFDQLLANGVSSRIDVRAVNASIFRRIWNCGDRVINVFGTDEQLYTPDVIMQETLMKRAKLIHARYIRRSDRDSALCESRGCDESADNCLKCDVCRESWERLDSFKRGSNILQADHMSVKVREVLGEDVTLSADVLRAYKRAYERKTPAEKKSLMELEHIRWMRYHIFHGWSYDPVRDDGNKRHNMLVPYDHLPSDQWVKDEDAYTMISEILQLEGFGGPSKL